MSDPDPQSAPNLEGTPAVTITAVSLAPVQRDGYTQIWVGNNVPQHLIDHWVGRTLSPRRLEALGARREGDQWLLNYMGRDFFLQSAPRVVDAEVVYNEPRPYPVKVME